MNEPAVRVVYNELQGYLFQTPLPKDGSFLYDVPVNVVNGAIDRLTKETQQDYGQYKVQSYPDDDRTYVKTIEYRQKLGGLISRLHAEHFSDETAPFSGSPSTVNFLSQNQSQNVDVRMLLNFQSMIDEKISEYSSETEEGNFLKKVKEGLANVKNVNELIRLVLQTAKDCGLALATLYSLFS